MKSSGSSPQIITTERHVQESNYSKIYTTVTFKMTGNTFSSTTTTLSFKRNSSGSGYTDSWSSSRSTVAGGVTVLRVIGEKF